jgi:hypothetical protein
MHLHMSESLDVGYEEQAKTNKQTKRKKQTNKQSNKQTNERFDLPRGMFSGPTCLVTPRFARLTTQKSVECDHSRPLWRENNRH